MDSSVSIQWLGDISLNGPFCDPQQAAAVSENLRTIAAQLGPCDLRIANWESPLWGDGQVNLLKVPRLATLPHIAAAVEPLKLDVVLLANNHVYDCLQTGYENTVAFLRKMGTVTIGAGRSEREAARPLVIERRGVRVGLLNYVGYDTHPNLPPDARVYLNWFEEKRALSEISALRDKTDAVLVHLHWGDDEFVRMPTTEQRRIARRLVDAGAKVVVGGHAHVFQGHEPWANGYIFHGIGNFLFWPPQAPLQHSGPWPRYVREIGVACCRLEKGRVGDVAVQHLLQEGLALRWDETTKRKRTESKLSRAFRLPDGPYARTRRIESFVARHIVDRVHAIRQAGGFSYWIAAKYRQSRAAQQDFAKSIRQPAESTELGETRLP